MEYRTLGQTGLKVSALGFGCGAIGGLLVRGDYPTMRRTVARAIELGVNYFDTASMYGDGQSEVNLGAVLRELGADVLVGTKARLAPADRQNVEAAIIWSVEASLRRMGREAVDLIHFHNPIESQHRAGEDQAATLAELAPVLHAFQLLERQGKVRFWGITGLGATDALHQAVSAGGLHTVQVCYNLLNPTAGNPLPFQFPFQDYRQLVDLCAEHQLGVIAIRVLAGGALSGTTQRHPVAAQTVSPIGTAPEFSTDVAKAHLFDFLVEEGYCRTLVEAAIRFVLGKAGVSTALVGISSPEQLEDAVAYAGRGALPTAALARLPDVWRRFASTLAHP
jgi:aryl-alcohol dehydrogenase-like predicted oxidoreductase